MISGSFASGETEHISEGIFDLADITLIHKYGESKTDNYYSRSEKVNTFHDHSSTKNKPVKFDEMGSGPTLDYCTDMGFHTNIWATSLMGSFGCGWNWWWDGAIFPQGYQSNFKQLAAFFKNEQLASGNYSPKKYKDAFSFNKAQIESFYLVNRDKTNVLGWLHNISYQWFNLQNNSCVDSLLINNNGKHYDKGDGKDYKTIAQKNRSRGHFTDDTGLEIKIEGLKKRSHYTIQWHSTTGKDAFSSETETIETNGRGIATINVPEKLSEYGDAAFKIYYFPGFR